MTVAIDIRIVQARARVQILHQEINELQNKEDVGLANVIVTQHEIIKRFKELVYTMEQLYKLEKEVK